MRQGRILTEKAIQENSRNSSAANVAAILELLRADAIAVVLIRQLRQYNQIHIAISRRQWVDEFLNEKITHKIRVLIVAASYCCGFLSVYYLTRNDLASATIGAFSLGL